MPQYTGNGARTNTVGGKNVVLRQMTKHYQALADMRPHIDNGEPESRIRVKNLKESIRKSKLSPSKKSPSKKSINSPLGYKRAPKPKNTREKCMIAIKKIKNEKATFNKPSICFIK